MYIRYNKNLLLIINSNSNIHALIIENNIYEKIIEIYRKIEENNIDSVILNSFKKIIDHYKQIY